MDLVSKKFITFAGIKILFIKHCSLNFMPGNTWWLTKVGAKLVFNLVIFLTFSSDIPLDFHESTRVVPLKYLMYFWPGINTK